MDNPYASPSSNLDGGETYSQSGEIGPRTTDIMSRTLPWARLAGIALFISAGIGLIGIFSPAAAGVPQKVVNLLGSLLNIYLGVKMTSYAARIADHLRTGQAADLERALNEHRLYWKVLGVLILVGFSLGAVGLTLIALVGPR